MKDLSPYFLQQPPPAAPETTALVPRGPIISSESPHLWDYWQVIKKHRWSVVVCFVAVVLTTVLLTLTMTPIYVAETTLLIERKAPKVLDVREVQAESALEYDEYDYYKTQYEILKSRALAAQVIREQGLERNRLFLGEEKPSGPVARFWANAITWLHPLLPASPKAEGEISLGVKPELISAYLGGLEIKPVQRTRLVRIAFSTPDPKLSASVANAHAAAYVRQGIDLRSQANETGLRFLEEKLVELKERIEKSETALNQYRRDKGIISLEDKENIVLDRLTDLNKRLTEAEADRITLEAQVQQIRRDNVALLPAVIDSPLIQALKQQLTTLEGEAAQLAAQFKDDYPRLKQVKAQVEEINRRLDEEIQRVVGGITAAYQTALGKESELRVKMEEQKAATLSLKDASVEYAVLARDVDTNRQLYDSVIQRIKEMGVATELRTSNVSVIDKADPPQAPAKPRKRVNLLFSALVGLLGGVGLAFFFEYLDNTFKTPEEAERELHLPTLCIVPHFSRINNLGSGGTRRMEQEAEKAVVFQGAENGGAVPQGQLDIFRKQLFIAHQLSVVSEAYRSLRAGILLSRAEEPPKTILFTSGVHAEGKTSTTLKTAASFAQMGVRVLVIDADLRRPACHHMLRMKSAAGLVEVLTGHDTPQEVIRSTAVENLFLLGSGALPPNPAELVGSRKMHHLLSALREQYDYIFIDSPPVMPVSDALLLSQMVDGVVMVVGGQETPKKVVKEACARLSYARAKVLGTVLNKVDLQRSGYYYHNYYYYTPYRYDGGVEAE